jgi:hypothetical protein
MDMERIIEITAAEEGLDRNDRRRALAGMDSLGDQR